MLDTISIAIRGNSGYMLVKAYGGRKVNTTPMPAPSKNYRLLRNAPWRHLIFIFHIDIIGLLVKKSRC